MFPHSARPLVAVMASLVLGSACSAPEVHLNSLTTLNEGTRGAELSDDGSVLQAGMRDTTCAFDTRSGLLLDDVNLPGETDAIVDAGRGGFLGLSPDALHHIDGVVETLPRPGVIDGLITDDGVVALVQDGGGCAIVWPARDTRTDLPSAACTGSLSGDRDGNRVGVTGIDGSWLAGPDGILADLETPASDAIWLQGRDWLVLATPGGLLTVDRDGAPITEHDLVTDDIALFGDGLIGARVDDGIVSIDLETGDRFGSNDVIPDGEMSGSPRGVVVFTQDDRVQVTELTTGSIDPYSRPADNVEVFD